MFFVNIDNCNHQFTVTVENGRAVWDVYCAFRKLWRTDTIPSWMTVVSSRGEYHLPEGGSVSPPIRSKIWTDHNIPLNEFAEKRLKELKEWASGA